MLDHWKVLGHLPILDVSLFAFPSRHHCWGPCRTVFHRKYGPKVKDTGVEERDHQRCSQALPKTYWIQMFRVIKSPGDSRNRKVWGAWNVMCPPNEFLRFLRTVMNLRISTPHRNVWTPGVQRNHQVFNPSSSSLVTPPVWGDRSQMVCTHLTLLGAPVFLWGCSRLFIPLWISEPGMSF